MSEAKTRHTPRALGKLAKKRTTPRMEEVGRRRTPKPSLRGVNEHFEPVFNAVFASVIVFQRFQN